MKTRLLAAFLLAMTLAGCPSPSSGPAGVANAPAASGGSVPSGEFSLQGSVLAPKPDSERINQEFWVFAAYYGEDFSKKLTVEEFGGLMLPEDGRLTLPLKVRIARGNASGSFDPDWIDHQAGLQVRLIHHYADAENNKLYRYCDVLTTAPAADGRNAVFSDIDLRQGGSLEVFLVDPVDHSKHDGTLNLTPTPDFSASCVDMTPSAYNAWQLSQIRLGNILLMVPLMEETAPSKGFGADQIIVIPDAGDPQTQPLRPSPPSYIPREILYWHP